MRQSMYIPQEEQEVVLYRFALQRRQDQLQQWKLEEGHPRRFQEPNKHHFTTDMGS